MLITRDLIPPFSEVPNYWVNFYTNNHLSVCIHMKTMKSNLSDHGTSVQGVNKTKTWIRYCLRTTMFQHNTSPRAQHCTSQGNLVSTQIWSANLFMPIIYNKQMKGVNIRMTFIEGILTSHKSRLTTLAIFVCFFFPSFFLCCHVRCPIRSSGKLLSSDFLGNKGF